MKGVSPGGAGEGTVFDEDQVEHESNECESFRRP